MPWLRDPGGRGVVRGRRRRLRRAADPDPDQTGSRQHDEGDGQEGVGQEVLRQGAALLPGLGDGDGDPAGQPRLRTSDSNASLSLSVALSAGQSHSQSESDARSSTRGRSRRRRNKKGGDANKGGTMADATLSAYENCWFF